MASTDYRSFFDRDYIYAYDLEGKDVTVTIERVVRGELTGQGGRKTKKPVVYFVGHERGLALNKTNGKILASLYSNDTALWPGKQITLYPTTTEMAGETVDCVRIRPKIPQPVDSTPPKQQREKPIEEKPVKEG